MVESCRFLGYGRVGRKTTDLVLVRSQVIEYGGGVVCENKALVIDLLKEREKNLRFCEWDMADVGSIKLQLNHNCTIVEEARKHFWVAMHLHPK